MEWIHLIMKGDKCEFCEGEMEQQRILARFRYREQTIYVENVPAWVCNKCGEQYFDAPVYKRLEKIAQQHERIQRTICFPLAEFDMFIAQ
jgi:YgiT-type zinc finger domain-containing protein